MLILKHSLRTTGQDTEKERETTEEQQEEEEDFGEVEGQSKERCGEGEDQQETDSDSPVPRDLTEYVTAILRIIMWEFLFFNVRQSKCFLHCATHMALFSIMYDCCI